MTFLLAFFITLIACIILVPLLTALGKFFCLFAVVQECEAHVFLLFGRVIGIIDEPACTFLPSRSAHMRSSLVLRHSAPCRLAP